MRYAALLDRPARERKRGYWRTCTPDGYHARGYQTSIFWQRLESPCRSDVLAHRKYAGLKFKSLNVANPRSTYRVGQKLTAALRDHSSYYTKSAPFTCNNGRKRWKRWWFARIPRSGRLRRTLRLLSPSGHPKRTCHQSRIPFPFRPVGLQSVLLSKPLFWNMEVLACMLQH